MSARQALCFYIHNVYWTQKWRDLRAYLAGIHMGTYIALSETWRDIEEPILLLGRLPLKWRDWRAEKQVSPEFGVRC